MCAIISFTYIGDKSCGKEINHIWYALRVSCDEPSRKLCCKIFNEILRGFAKHAVRFPFVVIHLGTPFLKQLDQG